MDEALVRRAAAGDHDAFDRLAAGLVDRAFGVARRVLRDRGLAEDAVQETLLAAWRDLPMLRDPGRFEAWVMRMLLNRCRDLGRRHARHAIEVTIADDASGAGFEADVAIELDVVQRDALERAMRRLSTEQREVVVLTHYLGLGAGEVAEIAAVPVGTVHSRLHYAMRSLRAALEADARPPARTAEEQRA
jgi:RNA polymerase sigma-70 factor (ECF subfamily)